MEVTVVPMLHMREVIKNVLHMQHPSAEREGDGSDIVMEEMEDFQKGWAPQRTPGSGTTQNAIWKARASQKRTLWIYILKITSGDSNTLNTW